MKKIKLIVFAILIVSVLFGIAGCKKKFDEVTSEEFVNALEEVVGLSEEDIKFREMNNEITNYYLCYDEYFFIDTIITVSPPSPYITSEYYRYHVYQDEEHAQEYFEELSENRREMYGSNAEWCIEDDYCYVIYSMDGTERYADYGAAINELESRYDTDELVLYGGVYYYDTTIISVQRLSDNEEDIEEIRDFLDELGLPHL